MTLHPQLQTLVHTHGALVDDTTYSATEFRQRYSQWSQTLALADDAAVNFGNFRFTTRHGHRILARLYMPKNAARQPTPLVYFHGGHAVAGSIDTHHTLMTTLCTQMQVGLVCADLLALTDLGWKVMHEAAQDVVQIVQRKTPELKLGSQAIWVGGDGTGALLAWQAARQLAYTGAVKVDAAFLLCPYSKPDLNTSSQIIHAASPFLSRPTIARAWQTMLGDSWAAWRPDLVPFHAPADTLHLVPSMVVGAQCDPLHDDAMHLYDLIINNGARAIFRGAPHMPHDFARCAAHSPQAQEFLHALCADFLTFANATASPTAAPASQAAGVQTRLH